MFYCHIRAHIDSKLIILNLFRALPQIAENSRMRFHKRCHKVVMASNFKGDNMLVAESVAYDLVIFMALRS
jgi:hypothetical protein